MANLSVQPNDRVTYKVRYEDDDVLVVAKPPLVVTLPGKGHEKDSLLNGIFAKYGTKLQNLGRDRDFGLLHRLDKETSGLVMIALSAKAYDTLRAAFEQRQISKFYWAIVRGKPKHEKGLIRKPIAEFKGETGDDPRTKKLARISSAGKPSITAYRVLDSSHTGSLLECRAVTGRLHQVRVHLESINCPILGDGLYGPSSTRNAAMRLALHAHRIVFPHPTSGERIDVRTPWPVDLKGVLKRHGLKRPDIPSSQGEVVTKAEEDKGDETASPPPP